MSRALVSDCSKRFSEAREEVKDDERPSRPVTAGSEGKAQKINHIIRKD